MCVRLYLGLAIDVVVRVWIWGLVEAVIVNQQSVEFEKHVSLKKLEVGFLVKGKTTMKRHSTDRLTQR